MPKVRRHSLPEPLFRHLARRVRERGINVNQLALLRDCYERTKCPSDHGSKLRWITVCGEGELVRAFLFGTVRYRGKAPNHLGKAPRRLGLRRCIRLSVPARLQIRYAAAGFADQRSPFDGPHALPPNFRCGDRVCEVTAQLRIAQDSGACRRCRPKRRPKTPSRASKRSRADRVHVSNARSKLNVKLPVWRPASGQPPVDIPARSEPAPSAHAGRRLKTFG